METEVSLAQLAQYAGNRVELYQKLSTVLDLPTLCPAITLDYLKSLLLPDCPYFTITREETRMLPQANYKRRFDAKETLKILEKILRRKKLKPTGFDQWAMPDIRWMLRMVIALEPTQK